MGSTRSRRPPPQESLNSNHRLAELSQLSSDAIEGMVDRFSASFERDNLLLDCREASSMVGFNLGELPDETEERRNSCTANRDGLHRSPLI